ncbi:hypothetical protein LCGC14_1097980 [marine sediment metagenome]|uniref:Uncharacterized protein n=1 Tax=marine sediment metagenome TaxID=412755 RepID=A0A0F9QGG6_9ZZZZ|nr:hypothetical protein [Nitrosopumilus sp.]
MLIKMAIIGAILLGGGVLFANEINQFLPETSVNLLDSVKNDFGKIKDDTVQSTETRVKGTIVTVTNEVNNIQEKSSELLSKSAKEVADSTQKGIKEVTDSTQKGIKEITKSTQETIFGGNGNNQNTNSNEEHEDGNSSTMPDNGNTVTQTDDENIISFETLSLKITQQSGDGVMLQYEDTSGKTISVSVTLRTTERELFSGIFYSSMFETLVNDASNTAYFIDMVVEHQEYGTISSSVYNPRDSSNTIINGVFFQS